LRRALKSICDGLNIKYRNPVIDMPIRWNSTLAMLNRALQLRRGINALCTDKEILKKFALTKAEWSLIEKMVEFLNVR